MCGIAGLIDFSGSLDAREISALAREMADNLAHRGPDDSGVWLDKDFPLALAHQRLSILDLSPSGRQPKLSSSGRYVVSYNGEIYNFKTLRRELEDLGCMFEGASDTEILLGAFEQWGEKALDRLNGMFAFALWDRQEKSLLLARDRLGKKPLYVGWSGKSIVFASELKALRVCPGFEADINSEALDAFLRYGWVPAPRSIYKRFWQLLPGYACRIDSSLQHGQDLSQMFKPYWQLADYFGTGAHMPLSDEKEALSLLKETLLDAVGERMVSDVPLGAFLSGGIDSSLVVAIMQELSNKPVKTFTIGFKEKRFNEAQHAAKIANHLGTEHHELYLDETAARDIIPMLSDIQDEPFADESIIPTYLVSRFAREHVTVALSGDGGDEMFGGYRRYFLARKIQKISEVFPKSFLKSVAEAGRFMSTSSGLAYKIYKALNLAGSHSAFSFYDRMVSRWPAEAQLVMGYMSETSPLKPFRLNEEAKAIEQALMFYDACNYLPDNILVKLDRASMAVSLECRAPLLDRRIAELSARIPLHMKIRGGKGKWILREALGQYIPVSMYDRPKQGFSVPIAAWLSGSLRDWAGDLLDEKKLRDSGLNVGVVQKSFADFQKGDVSLAPRLWSILMYMSWRERWM